MKKPSVKNLGNPPSMDEINNAPTAVGRKSTDKRGKGDQMNFPCSPELKREIKMFCVELGITQTEYLEKAHRFYFAHYKKGEIS
ncbi:hypothetical protein IAJ44_004262 [Salmonella enterica]|nr:hypothetical protein [Salmonella enterica subsp. enterica serovar Mississippi]EGD6457201.1 hypothetical protein [Salmonella enterica]